MATTVRLRVPLVLALVASLAAMASASADEETSHDVPPTAIAGARTASVGDTTYRVDDGGTGVLRVEDGHDLDQYLFASSSPLDFAITTRPLLESLPEVDRDDPWGPTDADGRPVEGNTFFERQGRLTLRVWDVDDDYAGTDVAPEIDEVVFNGELLPGALSGADGQWSVNTFEVPLRLLQLPTDEDPDGRNEIDIRIDTGNGGIDNWAVKVGWAELRLDSSAPPTALAHGFQETAAVMQPIEDHLLGQVDDLDDGSVARLEHDAEGTIEDNADTIAEEVTDLLTATGSATLNMVSHSKGGLDSRLFAWDNPGLVNHLVMLGTPNGGSELADDWCDSVNGLSVRAAISTWFGPDPGECDGPEDPIHQLRQDYVQDTFNVAVPDRPGIDYFTIAGQEGIFPANWILNGEDDGAVTVDSVRWLRRDHPDHPGWHDYWPDALNEDHFDLRQPGSASFPILTCRLYAAWSPTDGCDGDMFDARAATRSVAQSTPVAEPEVVFGDGRELAPGASVELPLAFEGSAAARIVVLTDHPDDLSASHPGASFQPTSLLGVAGLAAEVVDPADAPVTITNTGEESIAAITLVWITTDRQFVTTAAPDAARRGDVVSVTAVPTTGGAGSGANLRITDAAGAVVVDQPMTSDGSGGWTLDFTPATPGIHTATVHVTGSQPRTSSTTLSVGSGDATIGSGFTESAERAENGEITTLTISPTVTTVAPGRYRLSAVLRGSDGRAVATAGFVGDLDGTTAVPLDFDGRDIHRSGQDGPFAITDVVLSRAGGALFIEDRVDDLGTTSLWTKADFWHAKLAIDRTSFADRAADVDGDGLHDAIEVTGSVRVETAATYAVNARLVDADGVEVAEAQSTVAMGAGDNPLVLSFSADGIVEAGSDGPYDVVDLSVYPLSTDDALGYLVFAHRTAPYPLSGFVGVEASFGGLSALLVQLHDDADLATQLLNPLQVKVDAAAKAFERGRTEASCNVLGALDHHLEASPADHITSAAKDQARNLVAALVDQVCPT